MCNIPCASELQSPEPQKKSFKQFCSNYIKSFKSGIFLVLLDNNLSSEWHQKASIPLFKCAKDIGSESSAYLLQCPSHQCKCLCPIAGSLESEKMGKIKVVSFQIKLHVRLKAKKHIPCLVIRRLPGHHFPDNYTL